MASQVSASYFFSESNGGAPVLIESSDGSAPTVIHGMVSALQNHQQAVFMEVHNNSATRVDFVVWWCPWSAESGMANPSALYYSVGPYADVIVANGLRIGRLSYDGGEETQGDLVAYCVSGADEGNLAVRGYVLDIDEPGVDPTVGLSV